MNDEQLIIDLIKQGESEQLEFKKEVRPREIANTLCAFLNTDGGIILLGVQDDGTVTGIQNIEQQEAVLKDFLVKSIVPEAPITISTETIDNKTVLSLKVWKGSKPPYVSEDTIYYRRKNQTRKANFNEISKLIRVRQETEIHWERQIAFGFDLKDLDELEIRKTIQDLEKSGRGKAFAENQLIEFLTHYGLYHNGNLTNAAVVLYAKDPARFLPQCRVRLTVFKGSKTSDSFVYDRILEGNLFRNIDEILQFFDVNIATQSVFSDKKWLRDDRPFPKLALREGLMNALIHRDYSNISGSVNIAFYPDHLEITNYGELPKELKPADLGKNHLSLPRNPDIAHICFLRQMIEKIGRGTIKIIEDCNSKGYPKPKWESSHGVTTLIFNGITIHSKTDDAVNDAVNDVVNDAVNDAVNKSLFSPLSDTVNDAVSEIAKAIAADINGLSISEIMDITGRSNATVKRYLQILRVIGFAEFRGASKTGRYFITKDALSKISK